MKKTFVLFCSLITFLLHAQERPGVEQFIPTNSPDAMAFSQVNFLPINDYNGKPNVTIPIYEIDFGGIKVPIQLSYNYGGVKVNSIASSVGTNWNLSAGGSVVRQINGLNDYTHKPNSIGYMSDAIGISDCEGNQYRESEPDLYNVAAPGINTSFITPYISGLSIIDCKEINKLGNQITLTEGFYDLNLNVIEINPDPLTTDFEPIKVEITNTNGLQYLFEDFSSIVTNNHQTEWVNGIDQFPSSSSDAWTSSIDLTSITNPITGKQIDFEYSLPYNQNEFTIYKGAFKTNGDLSTKIIQYQATKSKKLSKITFDHGTVEFFYDFVRLDIINPNDIAINNNALTRILVKNQYGKIIKDARFNYSNVASTEGCTDEDCYRLFLDSVEFIGADGGALPGYDLTYNSTTLPKRYSYKQDFLGFSNGVVANPEPTIEGHYIPKTYHYAGQGYDSFLPLDIGNSNYIELGGNYSLAPNETYAKGGLLEKITYPTGGYTLLTAESNQFTHLGATINGGGLRIQKQELYDHDNTLERVINYDYSKVGGGTSGFITNMPRFNDYKIVSQNDDYGLRIYQNDMSNQKITNASFIGYERVKISESGNGYTIKEYTTPNDYPNLQGSWNMTLPNINGSPPPNGDQWDMPTGIITQKVANGCFPSIVTDRDLLRGTLTKISHFNETDGLLKKSEYTYHYKEYESIGVGGGIPYVDPNSDGCDPHAYLSEGAYIQIARNPVKTTIDYSYFNGQTHSVSSTFTYEDDYPFIKEKSVQNSDGDVHKTEFIYPYNSDYDYPEVTTVICPQFEYLDDLIAQNRISTPILINTYRASTLTGNSLMVFKKFYEKYDSQGVPIGTNFISESPFLEKEIIGKTPILNILPKDTGGILDPNQDPQDLCDLTSDHTKYIIHQYNSNGKPREISEQINSSHTILIWGYGNEHLIGKIENATLFGMPPLLGGEIAAIKTLSNSENSITVEAEIRDRLNALVSDTYFVDTAQLTTYTYDPLIGVTSSTDPRARVVFYHYDEFNRLEHVTDHDGNVLTENEYNFKPQN